MLADDLPQTVEQAEALGWTWLRVACPLPCKRSRTFPLERLRSLKDHRLAVIAWRFKCLGCGRQDGLILGLEAWDHSNGTPWHRATTIAAQGHTIVHPSRE